MNFEIAILTFTKNGIRLAEKLKDAFPDRSICIATRYEAAKESPEFWLYYTELGIEEWAKAAFEKKQALIFVGSTGIAVRAIASSVKDKLTDSPVLVMDERGTYVISLLSGHMGGANELAAELAAEVGAIPVITTATDLNDAFSVDLFAKEQNLAIRNRDEIKRVSTKAIEGKPIRMSIEGFPPRKETDVVIASDKKGLDFAGRSLVLCPKTLAVGMGCKKNKAFAEIEALFLETLECHHILLSDVGCICSVDVKAEEEGLLELSQKYRLPFLTFDAETLRKVEGEFSASAFVSETVGVDNVCERSAMAAVGPTGRLLVSKTAKDGVTIAVAKVSE